MIDITIVAVAGRDLRARVAEMPAKVHDALLAAITRMTADLEEAVRSGAPRKTGRLQASIVSRVFDDGDRIKGRVSVSGDYAKAATIEYGSHRAAKVKAHAFELDHVYGRRVEPLEVMTRAYTRQLDILAAHFLRGPFDAMRGLATAGLQAALDEAVTES